MGDTWGEIENPSAVFDADSAGVQKLEGFSEGNNLTIAR